VCGWCDGIITFGDGSTCGTDGQGCCGGSSGFSKCSVAYRKECPVICDRSDYTSPKCREATPAERNSSAIQKFADCATVEKWGACDYGQYCDTQAKQCKNVPSKAICAQTPGCDPDNPGCNVTACSGKPSPSPPSPSPLVYCVPGSGCKGPVSPAECKLDPNCDPDHPGCNPTTCSAPPPTYSCDQQSFQCAPAPAGSPPAPFNSSKACEDACYDHKVDGVWRGIQIESNFAAGEWDFQFSSAASGGSGLGRVSFGLRPTQGAPIPVGSKLQGSYAIGSALMADAFPSFEIVITLDQSCGGGTLKGIFSNKDEGPLTRYMYLTLDGGGAPADYVAGMAATNMEWTLVACKYTIGACNFSPAAP